jgi:indolepyruvate ferredoxin oxidoreductase alpha subunit
VADAAVLCPSFFRAEIVQNARGRDRLLWRVRRYVIEALQEHAAARMAAE